jgi:hypothetical protein
MRFQELFDDSGVAKARVKQGLTLRKVPEGHNGCPSPSPAGGFYVFTPLYAREASRGARIG